MEVRTLAKNTIWALGAGLGLAVLGAAWQRAGERRDRRRFPPPGRMVALDGALDGEIEGPRLHCPRLHCMMGGAGAGPTVVFEAALGASSLSWILVQPAVAEFASAFSYDRAGMGWSESGPAPRTGDRAVVELRRLLAAAGAPPPFVLVGHSYGGLLMRLFAAHFPRDVAGLVLVDGAAPEQWTRISDYDRRRLATGARLARRGAWATRWGLARLVRLCVTSGALRSARAVAAVVSGGVLGPSDRGLLTPVHRLPEAARRPLPMLWTQTRFYDSLAEQIDALPDLAATVADLERGTPPIYADLPLAVISASDPSPERVREQEAAAALSSVGRHVIAPECGHWVQLDQPEFVVAVIRQIVGQAQRRGASRL